MDSVVQALLNLSKLDVTLIRITHATAKTFVMSIESRTTNTGPLPAKMAAMTVDLVGPGGKFSTLDLPAVKTASKGVDVNITEQLVTITDMDAFVAYLKSVQLDSKVSLALDNGQGTVNALGMTSKIIYKKDVALLGMDGPQIDILDAKKLDDGTFETSIKITNPSPIELDFGKLTFGLKNAAGELLATLIGNVYIVRGETIFKAVGEVKQKGDTGKVNLVGLEAAKDTWLQSSLAFFNNTVRLPADLKELLSV